MGIDTDKVLDQMQDFHLSMHCWQADDVAGFENQGGSLTGGIQVNGNYPGRLAISTNSARISSMQ